MKKVVSNIQKFIEYKAYCLRRLSIMMTSRAGSGHPTSCLSAADIVAVIFFYAMYFDPYDYENPDNDRFILSKGHAAPLLYAAWKELGLFSEKELLTYREFNSVFEGHPTRRFVYAEAATGSLGIGLSIGVGEALSAHLDKRQFRTYVVIGDSESSEGSIWEAVQVAAYYKLNNLIAFLDCNNLGQSTETMMDYEIKRYVEQFTAFGWHAYAVDGHDVAALMDAVNKAQKIKNKPVMIIAKTIKGYGVDFVAGLQGFHGKAFKEEKETKALTQLKNNFSAVENYENSDWHPQKPKKSGLTISSDCSIIIMPSPEYKKDDVIATRKAYGQALAGLGDVCDAVVSLDAEVKNSTYAELFEAIYPQRFFQCFVAEQNMVGMGMGFERRGKIPFISTFSCFLSRAHDQIRMAAISNSALRLVGSHCGVSIGEDGPSQMGLEDIAMVRCLPDSVVLYPSDVVSTHQLVEQMARYNNGISYLRTTRMETPILYKNNEKFFIGGCKVLRKSEKDHVCIVAAGVTLHEALKAHEILAQDHVFISIIDLYSVKPLDSSTVISVALSSGKKIITVEDHYMQGGLGEAVMSATGNQGIAIHIMAVEKLPRSGKTAELLSFVGIDAAAIVKKVKNVMR